MKVKIFYGIPETVEEEFNEWAKGKALSRNVIIHTSAYPTGQTGIYDAVIIAVYYPEGLWPEEEEKQ